MFSAPVPQQPATSRDEAIEHLVRGISHCLQEFLGNKHDDAIENTTMQESKPKLSLFGPKTTALANGILLPTHENLLETLRERFLSIFGVASLLKDQKLSAYHPQGGLIDLAPPYSSFGPIILGKDLHIEPSFVCDPSAWSSILQVDLSGGNIEKSEAIMLPLTHVRQHPLPLPGATSKVEQAAALVRALWPDSRIDPPKHHMRGPRFTDPKSPEFVMSSWVASQSLNTKGVDLKLLLPNFKGYFVSSCTESVLIFPLLSSHSVTNIFSNVRYFRGHPQERK
ncbi:hypothetical protein F5B20DRAFT_583188 [Whalleya microplaca]|nr:hypothetical protein F5B20DRAFT_583188 [Whalleya microplaca]